MNDVIHQGQIAMDVHLLFFNFSNQRFEPNICLTRFPQKTAISGDFNSHAPHSITSACRTYFCMLNSRRGNYGRKTVEEVKIARGGVEVVETSKGTGADKADKEEFTGKGRMEGTGVEKRKGEAHLKPDLIGPNPQQKVVEWTHQCP